MIPHSTNCEVLCLLLPNHNTNFHSCLCLYVCTKQSIWSSEQLLLPYTCIKLIHQCSILRPSRSPTFDSSFEYHTLDRRVAYFLQVISKPTRRPCTPTSTRAYQSTEISTYLQIRSGETRVGAELTTVENNILHTTTRNQSVESR